MSKIWLSVHIEEDMLDHIVDHILEKFPLSEKDFTIDESEHIDVEDMAEEPER